MLSLSIPPPLCLLSAAEANAQVRPLDAVTYAKALRRMVRYSVLASSLLLCACDQVRGLLPRQEEPASIYEFRTDDQGRTLRLNKATGEIAVVKVPERVPAKPSAQSATLRPATQRPARTRQSAAENTRQTVAVAEPQRVAVGSPVTITSASLVFATANANQTPLARLEKGVVATLLGAEGDWNRIEFDSPTRGRLVGFVAKSASSLDNHTPEAIDPDLRPMNLSVPDPGLKPTDLSIADPGLKPIDLSVPPTK